jgi:hypothetical protein
MELLYWMHHYCRLTDYTDSGLYAYTDSTSSSTNGAVYVHFLEIEAGWSSRLVIMTVTLSSVTFTTVTLVTVSTAQTDLQGSDIVSAVTTTEVEKQCYALVLIIMKYTHRSTAVRS